MAMKKNRNPLNLYNTLTRQKEIFKSIKKKTVSLYTCGPTVYNFAHLGNLRTYIFEDVLKRVLIYNGYKVKHVMNITDVGHLTSDADVGEDKIEKSAKKEGKTPQEIAEFYTKAFKRNLKDLNIIFPSFWPRATKHIKEQIELIKKLEKLGFTYRTSDGIYFDTSKLKDYGKLARLDIKGLQAGTRVEIKEKRNPTDFALWKFSPQEKKRLQEWDSPWGIGFPGWHTECVAMSIKYLGIPFDIHCGGIDHIPVHHTNEIAQAEAVYKKPLANFWLHGEFLLLDKEKMAKSAGQFITLQTVIDKGYHPLAYRYLCLTTHWQSPLNFSWTSLDSAQNALNNLYENVSLYIQPGKIIKEIKDKFKAAINDNLDTPKALAITWDLIRESRYSAADKIATLVEFDKIFGLKLKEREAATRKIPKKIQHLISQREKLRKEKKWQEADKYREKLKNLGYKVEDTPSGPLLKKIIL
jgi:cysteinyl-tRNA synthetase